MFVCRKIKEMETISSSYYVCNIRSNLTMTRTNLIEQNSPTFFSLQHDKILQSPEALFIKHKKEIRSWPTQGLLLWEKHWAHNTQTNNPFNSTLDIQYIFIQSSPFFVYSFFFWFLDKLANTLKWIFILKYRKH